MPKGDNFMVDENDELWIIDFGGSFTEGWVEEKYMETEEGDDMGVGKVREGLRDPDGFTFDPEEEGIVEGKNGAQKKEGAGQESLKQGTKRAREDDQEEEEVEEEEEEEEERRAMIHRRRGSVDGLALYVVRFFVRTTEAVYCTISTVLQCNAFHILQILWQD